MDSTHQQLPGDIKISGNSWQLHEQITVPRSQYQKFRIKKADMEKAFQTDTFDGNMTGKLVGQGQNSRCYVIEWQDFNPKLRIEYGVQADIWKKNTTVPNTNSNSAPGAINTTMNNIASTTNSPLSSPQQADDDALPPMDDLDVENEENDTDGDEALGQVNVSDNRVEVEVGNNRDGKLTWFTNEILDGMEARPSMDVVSGGASIFMPPIADKMKPASYIDLYFQDEFFENILKWTNAYAASCNDSRWSPLGMDAHHTSWYRWRYPQKRSR
jgi:hypothetical protein